MPPQGIVAALDVVEAVGPGGFFVEACGRGVGACGSMVGAIGCRVGAIGSSVGAFGCSVGAIGCSVDACDRGLKLSARALTLALAGLKLSAPALELALPGLKLAVAAWELSAAAWKLSAPALELSVASSSFRKLPRFHRKRSRPDGERPDERRGLAETEFRSPTRLRQGSRFRRRRRRGDATCRDYVGRDLGRRNFSLGASEYGGDGGSVKSDTNGAPN